MSRSLIPKETIETLENGAPEGYDVLKDFFNIDIYAKEDAKELFDLLYLPEDKLSNAEYLAKMVEATIRYTADDLVMEEFEEVLSVEEKLIHEHRRASILNIDGEIVYAHYK